MIIIYTLIKLEQTLCQKLTLRTLYTYEYLFILPIFGLNLNTISYVLLSVLFVLSWMDRRIQSISNHLIILFFIVVYIHYVLAPHKLEYISMFICLFLLCVSKYTQGFGLGDVYILFGLSFLLNLMDFIYVLRLSFILALIIESIKKTKEPFAFIPYIYTALILFLTLNLD